MKTLFIKGNLYVKGSCTGKNITCNSTIDNVDAFIIEGNVTIEGNIHLDDNHSIITTGSLACTQIAK
jgi:hypothetical protein